VRILLPVEGTAGHHLVTFGRGDCFGGLSFLDQQRRSNEAVAYTNTDLFVLRRESFEKLAEEHKRLALHLVEAIARVLAMRLRYSDMELEALRA
jgi:SulP family sulfate permease